MLVSSRRVPGESDWVRIDESNQKRLPQMAGTLSYEAGMNGSSLSRAGCRLFTVQPEGAEIVRSRRLSTRPQIIYSPPRCDRDAALPSVRRPRNRADAPLPPSPCAVFNKAGLWRLEAPHRAGDALRTELHHHHGRAGRRCGPRPRINVPTVKRLGVAGDAADWASAHRMLCHPCG